MLRFENRLDLVHSLSRAMMPKSGRAPTALPLGVLPRVARLLVIGLLAGGAIAAWRWKAVLDPFAITAAIVYCGAKSDNDTRGLFPITIVTAMVSPSARPKPSMTAPTMPVRA